jgi:hypothetical protein
VSYGDELVPEHAGALPELANRSALAPVAAQLLDEHGLATGPQGPDKLQLTVWRHSAAGEEEVAELRQQLSVPMGGLVGAPPAGLPHRLLHRPLLGRPAPCCCSPATRRRPPSHPPPGQRAG